MEPSARNDRLSRLAWLPIPLLLSAMAVLWVADWSAAYEPPHLMMALNLFFMLPVSLLVAYQAGRSFLLRGNPKLLWFGCGMLFWGSAGPLGGILLPHGPDAVVAVHNTLIWLAAACHLAGVLLAPRQRAVVRWPEPWLAGGYIGTLLAVTAVVLTALSGKMPTFFVQGEGGTLLRQIVLGSAIIMFVSTAILLRGGNGRGVSSTFRYWYALALLLMAVGLFGVMVQSTVGSLLGWTGRIAQYLGSAYLIMAVVVAMRENHDWGHSLEIALGEARQRFEELIDLAGDGIVMHELIGETARGNFLQVNPAICALLGYTARELRELTPLDIIAPEDHQSIAEDSQVMRRDGLLRHEKTLLAKDGRRIPVEISTRQYQQQGRAMAISVIRDVSERNRAEAALRERTDRYELVLAGAQDAIWDWDVANKRVHFSPQWKTMRGYAEHEVGDRAEEWSAGIHPDDAPRVFTRLQEHFDGNTPVFAEEYRIRCKDGSWKWIFNRGIVQRDAAGRVARMAGSESDITERKRAEEFLKAERDRFEKIVATVPGVICSFRLRPDGSTCFPYASPAIQDLYGLRPEELAESAAALWTMIHPDDLGHINAGIATSAQTMTPWRDEFRVRHPSKGEIWVEGHSMPIREPDGGILWHGYVQDVTERKRAEQQLFVAHERLKALMESLPVGVSFSDDPSCQRVTGNAALLAQFEMTSQDNVSASAPDTAAAGRRVRYFQRERELHDTDLPLQRAVAENRVIPSTELEVRLPSGRRWFAEVTGAPLRDAKAQVIGGLAVVLDITERKQAEMALRALLEEKEVLLREVHHRVKNNLAAIVDLLELQRENAPETATSSLLAELRDRIKSMALIHEMLYQSANLSRVDFRGYLQTLTERLRDSLDPHGIIQIRLAVPEIAMNLDTAIPCGLIVNELVTNALKYAFPPHRPRLAASVCEIAIAADWDGAAYTLTVTDNGIGLPAGLDWMTTRTLGLRLVRMLGQHQLRGQLEFDGTRGTHFSLRFGPR
jgi:PAS domain S-box-containing protein